MSSIPPFAPALDAERAAGSLLLGQAERKRTGHMFKDCPARDLPVAKGKAKACKPCVDRWQDVGRLARTHQQAFDAAWYAEQAKLAQGKEAPMNLEAEQEMWGGIVRQEDEGRYTMPKIDAHEAGTVGAVRKAVGQVRTNRYGGKCTRCNVWIEAEAGLLTKTAQGKWGAMHRDGECPQAKPAAPVAPTEPFRAGAYRLADGRVIRVQMSKTTGNPYAVALDEAKTYLGGGRLLDGAVRLTEDEARQYGRKTGTCCVCGAHLENPESVAAGIGPICGGRQ